MGKLKNEQEAMEYPVEGNKSKNYEKFLSDLAYKESSNRHFIVNRCRFAGLYQIGAPAAGNSRYYCCKKDETTWNPNGWKNYNQITKFEEFIGVKDGFDIEKAIPKQANGERKEDEKYQEAMVSDKRKDNAIKAQTEMIISYHKASWNEIVYNVTTYDEYKNMKKLKTEKKYGQISEEIKRILGIGKNTVRNGVCCTHYNKDDKKTYKFTITQSGIIAALHLVGAKKVKPYLLTGEGSADKNGTRITEYMWRFADYDMTDLFNGKNIKYVPGSGANPEKKEVKSSGTGGTNGSGKGQDRKLDNVKHSNVKADNNTLYPDSASGKIVIRGFNHGDLKINIPRYDADGKGVTKKQENQNNTITESKIEYGTVTGKVVCDGAKIYCDAGGYSTLKSSKQSFFKINGKNVILESENTKSNIVPFKTCAASSGKKCTPVVKKPWSNTVDHLSILEENVVTTFSKVLCSAGSFEITIRDVNQQGVEYGAFAKVTRTEGAATGETKADDKKNNNEIKDAKPVTLDEKKSATTKINYTAISGKLPIKKGEKGEIVREINIRLMGFGGGLPSDEYNDYTVKVVKQFKEDYMGLKNADGTFVDMATIQAIDKFAEIFKIVKDSNAIFSLADIKCKCGTCSFKNSKGQIVNGFGSNKKDSRKNIEEFNSKTEHPGIHKTLLWIMRAAQFYLKLDGKSITNISDGYRCSIRNRQKGYTTTNHLGKAFDIHFGYKEVKTHRKDDKNRIWETNEVEKIRNKIFVKKIGAVQGWSHKKIGLERIRDGATSWVHFDIRELGSEYLSDEYFIDNADEIMNPKKLESLL